nr:CatB-related O-acetyltransferase [Campylobacter sp. P0138]
MGSISYSNAIIPRLDINKERYCSIANGLSFIAGKHPLDTISTSSFIYNPNFYIFKDVGIKQIEKPYTHTPRNHLIPSSPPTIFENDVYVCTNALLKLRITLYTGCVVAQNAIVTKDVPPYAIVGGSPARILKYRFNESTIKRLLELKW